MMPTTVAIRPTMWMSLYPVTAMNAVSNPKITMPSSRLSMCRIFEIACPASTVPVAAKPRYIRIASSSGTTAPRTPNCARLEIICGRPSLGPCAECSAMTAPPAMLPISRPRIAHSASAPNSTASAPSTMAVICMFAPNHKVN